MCIRDSAYDMAMEYGIDMLAAASKVVLCENALKVQHVDCLLYTSISRINYATDFYLIRTFYYKASRFASSLNDRKVYCLL